MKRKYKSVNTRTMKGLLEAEKLKENGWVIYSSGLYTLMFVKKSLNKKLNSLNPN